MTITCCVSTPNGGLGNVFLLTCSKFCALVYKAYGAFDAELCTTIWAPVLTNRQFKGCMFTYMKYISCVGQMQQKIQGIWCFGAVIFFTTCLVFFLSIPCCNAKQFNTIHVMQFDLLQSNFLITVLWNYLQFHCSVTLFFNSIHVQCCNADKNLSVCLFLLFVFQGTLTNSKLKFIDKCFQNQLQF